MAKQSTTPAQIRGWAAETGLSVGTRGRLSQSVQDAYKQAHKPARKPKAA